MSGYTPIVEPLILTRGADYVHRYNRHPNDPPFPDDTTAEIVITDGSEVGAPVIATWPALEVTADYIEFWVQSEDADLIDEGLTYQLYPHYPVEPPATDTLDFCWYEGQIERTPR
ncbi:hypothetical protein M1M07_32200 [Rhodococcus sp. HM1]|uniref:LtfC-like domain-containing protein n=1 Tax=Rhodococcus sp. HM1 TaxID=2937759 RepID=UPI002009F0A2|nr:hypothetical protein [Rhodococcus sp. HM1]MCK8675747.1 hypothetical protein [Rhodococcus sp. HM1]